MVMRPISTKIEIVLAHCLIKGNAW